MGISKNFIAFILMLTACTSLFAEPQKKVNLTQDVIKEIRKSIYLSSSDRAMMNALTNNKLTELALNRDFLTKHKNTLFNHKIKTKGITNQEHSGRCWLFAGLNMLRAKVIEEYKLKDFEFSQSYLMFWDKMEKSNFFLESIIETADRDLNDREVVLFLKNPIGDGGLWSYVVNLIDKYGVVPKEIMPESYNSSNSWLMNSLIARKLRKDATILRDMKKNGENESELEAKKLDMLKVIYKMLVLNLGEPPEAFEWRYEDREENVSEAKTYTPKEFYKKVVSEDLNHYVALMNYSGQEYDTLLQFDQSRNIYERNDPQYANLQIEKMKELAFKSILDDEPVWFACDIIKDGDPKRGILSPEIIDYSSVYGVKIELNKEERIRYRDSYANHAMVFTGVDVKGGKPIKWLVEDSHGSERGHSGHWSMYNDWFDKYVYVVIINREYLSPRVKDIFKQKPKHLPPWDPMIAILKKNK